MTAVARRTAGLAVLALGLALTLLLWGLPLGSAFIMHRRLMSLATLAVVAIAVGVATVLFHTVTANHVLTPSIMGLDSVYVVLQTVAVVALGLRGLGDARLEFLVVLTVMVAASVLLFQALLVRLGRSVHLMLLVGVLVGGLLRGVSSFLQRLLHPQAFQVLSDRLFADFTGRDTALVGVAWVLVSATVAWAWACRRELDVMALGAPLATGLGVDYRRASLRVLTAVSLLVGTATALVGPTMFLGLLAAHATYRALGSQRHAHTLPAVGLVGLIALVGGQLVLERLLGFEGSLSMVVELVGGVVFLAMLLRRKK